MQVVTSPVKTLPHNHFAVVRVVASLGTDGVTFYQVERRSVWWPFWLRAATRYDSADDAIAMAEAHLMVIDYLQRTVHEPHVVWKG